MILADVLDLGHISDRQSARTPRLAIRFQNKRWRDSSTFRWCISDGEPLRLITLLIVFMSDLAARKHLDEFGYTTD